MIVVRNAVLFILESYTKKNKSQINKSFACMSSKENREAMKGNQDDKLTHKRAATRQSRETRQVKLFEGSRAAVSINIPIKSFRIVSWKPSDARRISSMFNSLNINKIPHHKLLNTIFSIRNFFHCYTRYFIEDMSYAAHEDVRVEPRWSWQMRLSNISYVHHRL